ncbi:hypothetical protein HWV62_23559 [Athelia sp. TMB]|nr:hypothetical protein HWV62_23559 [Athelia sp. TMB]
MSSDRQYAAFFYGTLMHPEILKRVIGNDGTHLKICSAILLDYTRHQIKHADYPAVLPYSKSKALFNRELSPEEKSVRGSLVTGLSESDVRLLDVFEGDEYTRERVPVHPISAYSTLSPAPRTPHAIPAAVPHSHSAASLPPPVMAHTYIWCQPPAQLTPSLWSFEEFVAKNAWKWVGAGAAGNPDFLEVDKRREMGGFITRCGVRGSL